MKFDLKHVPKAKNLDLIGWTGGYVLVQFKGRPARYCSAWISRRASLSGFFGIPIQIGCSS